MKAPAGSGNAVSTEQQEKEMKKAEEQAAEEQSKKAMEKEGETVKKKPGKSG